MEGQFVTQHSKTASMKPRYDDLVVPLLLEEKLKLVA